jgi:hypothetical protein
MEIDGHMMKRIAQLERSAGRSGVRLNERDADGRRQTCRYAEAPYDRRCTGIPVGSEVAEIQLCLVHLRLALELIEAEGITLPA